MKKIMHILFLSCLKATELIEKRFHVKLSITEKIQLKLHKMMCAACANYEKHSTIIEHSLNNQSEKADPKINFVDLKSTIITNLGK